MQSLTCSLRPNLERGLRRGIVLAAPQESAFALSVALGSAAAGLVAVEDTWAPRSCPVFSFPAQCRPEKAEQAQELTVGSRYTHPVHEQEVSFRHPVCSGQRGKVERHGIQPSVRIEVDKAAQQNTPGGGVKVADAVGAAAGEL